MSFHLLFELGLSGSELGLHDLGVLLLDGIKEANEGLHIRFDRKLVFLGQSDNIWVRGGSGNTDEGDKSSEFHN